MPDTSPAGDTGQLVAKLRELHRPFGIYDECDCDPEEHAGKTITDCGEFWTCLDPMYSICAHCCRDASGEQTENCASSHQHGRGKPICETAAIIAAAIRRKDPR